MFVPFLVVILIFILFFNFVMSSLFNAFILLKSTFNALFIISIAMPGMLAILEPFLLALCLASVWLNDFVVGIKMTSYFSISSATSADGSAPCAFGIFVRISFEFFVIFNEFLYNSFPIGFSLESVTVRQLSLYFKPMQSLRIILH